MAKIVIIPTYILAIPLPSVQCIPLSCQSLHMQRFVKIYQFVLKILSENGILTSVKGHNYYKLTKINVQQSQPIPCLIYSALHAMFQFLPENWKPIA